MIDKQPETETRREFATRIGCKPGYVTHLAKTDRLVLTADGRRVVIAESLQRIEDTRDPSKAGVAERHAKARDAKASASTVAATTDSGADQRQSDEPTSVGYQQSKAKRELYLALAAQRDYEISMGQLMRTDEVLAGIRGIITGLRSALESLPANTCAQFAAESDEQRVRAMHAEAIEHHLTEASRRFADLAATSEHTT